MASSRFAATTERRAEIGRLRRAATMARKELAKLEAAPEADAGRIAIVRAQLASIETSLGE